eukprot:scaffold135122_cov54-Attheya_sp.AAC.4
MSHNTNQQQYYNNTGGQGMPSSDIKYDRDLQHNYWLPCPTNSVFYASSPWMAALMMEQQERNVPIFLFQPGSNSSSPVIPASMEQKESSTVPLFMLRSK